MVSDDKLVLVETSSPMFGTCVDVKMVHGIRFRVSEVELKKHLQARSEYHAQRAVDKKALLPDLEAVSEKIKALPRSAEQTGFSKNSMSNYRFDPAEEADALQKDIEHHQNRSLRFAYMADHLFTAWYVLTESDLIALEMVR